MTNDDHDDPTSTNDCTGERILDLRTPDGVVRIHAECIGGKEIR